MIDFFYIRDTIVCGDGTMNKRVVLPAILIIAFILNLGLNRLFTEAFLNQDFFLQIHTAEELVKVTSISTFLFSIPFYVIILICFRNYKDLCLFATITIIANLAFAFYTIMMSSSDSWTIPLRLFAGISYFGTLLNFFVSFGIVLQDYYDKLVTRSLMFFAIVNYVFASFYTQYSKGFIARVVGDFPPGNLDRTFVVYDWIYILIQLTMVVLSVLVILNLITRKEIGRKVYIFDQYKEEELISK